MSRKSIKSDLAKVDRLKDRDIDYSDIPPLDDAFFQKATMVSWPPAKQQVTVRLDADVLDWLRASGKGYQTRINYLLRTAMDHQRPRPEKPGVRSRRGRRAA